MLEALPVRDALSFRPLNSANLPRDSPEQPAPVVQCSGPLGIARLDEGVPTDGPTRASWRSSRRTHDSRALSAASFARIASPSLSRAASTLETPESRECDSGRGKRVLECSFANSPRFTMVGF